MTVTLHFDGLTLCLEYLWRLFGGNNSKSNDKHIEASKFAAQMAAFKSALKNPSGIVAGTKAAKARGRASASNGKKLFGVMSIVERFKRDGFAMSLKKDKAELKVSENLSQVQERALRNVATIELEEMEHNKITGGTFNAKTYARMSNDLRRRLRDIGLIFLNTVAQQKPMTIPRHFHRQISGRISWGADIMTDLCLPPPLFDMRRMVEDLKLMGKQLAPESFQKQKIILIASEGEELSREEAEIYKEMSGGRIYTPGFRPDEIWWCKGRRAGGTLTMAIKAAYVALAHGPAINAKLAPGERASIPLLGAVKIQAKKGHQYLSGIFQTIELFQEYLQGITAETILLNNNIDFEIRVNDYKSIRGITSPLAIIDEIAFFDQQNSANPDTEVLNAIRPSLASMNGQMWVTSSPYGRNGELFFNYKKHYGPEGDPLITFIKGSTRFFNPSIDQKIVDRAIARDPCAARTEWLGEFRDDVEAFINRELIESLVVPDRIRLPYDRNVSYQAFVDPSGGGQDGFCLCIAHMERGEKIVVDLLDEIQGGNPELAVARHAATILSFGMIECVGDKYGGFVFENLFRKYGITYRFSEYSKTELYSGALPLMNSGRVKLLDHAKLIDQFCGLERRVPRGSNKESIDHKQIQGCHDDCANSCAGAIVIAARNLACLQHYEDWSRRGDEITLSTFGDRGPDGYAGLGRHIYGGRY